MDLNHFLPEKNAAEISSIFKWFKGDFQKSHSVAKVMDRYGPPAAQILVAGGNNFQVSYLPRNWGLND